MARMGTDQYKVLFIRVIRDICGQKIRLLESLNSQGDWYKFSGSACVGGQPLGAAAPTFQVDLRRTRLGRAAFPGRAVHAGESRTSPYTHFPTRLYSPSARCFNCALGALASSRLSLILKDACHWITDPTSPNTKPAGRHRWPATARQGSQARSSAARVAPETGRVRLLGVCPRGSVRGTPASCSPDRSSRRR